MKLRRILRLVLAYLVCGPGILAVSMLVDAFLFRPAVRSWPDLLPWNRELNALSLILAAIASGALAVWLAQGEEKGRSLWPALCAAAEAIVLLWLLGRKSPGNPLTVGWRGWLMAGAGAVAGGALLIGSYRGRVKDPPLRPMRWIAWLVLIAALAVGFGTVRYDLYEIRVSIPSEGALLRGTLSVPGRRAGVAYPAVLLVPDLGRQDRDETWGLNGTFREVAEHLAANSYVVLRYDKRGCGESDGEFVRLGLDDFVRDATAAGAFLARRREVGEEMVFAVGHGTGGQVITLAALAERDLFSGLALLATPASPPSDWLRAQHRYALMTLDAAPAELEARLGAVDDWIEGVRTRRYLHYGDYFGQRGLSEALQAEQHATPLPPIWLRQALAHDQPAALASASLPVLILTGEADWRVPPTEAETLVNALAAAGRSDWTLRRLPGVNHHLVAVESMEAGFLLEQTGAYAGEKRPVAPAVLDALTGWLDQRVAEG